MSLKTNESILLKDVKFLNGDYELQRGTILLNNGKIQDIFVGDIDLHGDIEITGDDITVLPGLIDVHTHGAFGYDTMDARFEAINTISTYLAKCGITGFLPTTMTLSAKDIAAAFSNVKSARLKGVDGAQILGINMEGPYLNPEAKGAHIEEFLTSPQIEQFEALNEQTSEMVKLVTIAPEIDNAHKFIQYLKSKGIVASIGHTTASYEETNRAIKSGISHATHLFNAMPPLHHRNPGAVSAIMDSSVVAEIIADGIHIHPSIVKMAYRLKGAGHICLISDSMMAAGLEDGEYNLGGQNVTVSGGKATLENGTIAGGTTNIFSGVRNLVSWGIDLSEAVKMASLVPARVLGIEKTKGSIAKNKDADLIIVDKSLNLWFTIINGQIVYKKS